jgi:hypothetical protein
MAMLRVWFHPQRGTTLLEGAMPPGCMKYLGGKDADWREVAQVRAAFVGYALRPIPGQKLPAGFLWGDPERQRYGMAGPRYIYGPFTNTCRDCGAAFVLPASAQRHLYETLGVFTEVLAVRCQACARSRRAIEDQRAAYEAALHAADGATAPEPHLALARAALELVKRGGRCSLDRAISSCRRARRLGAGVRADRTEAALAELRDARRRAP